ncbi:hypothetical protein EB093_04375 [bacterium]|nr:hypothetical protein [bacterium]
MANSKGGSAVYGSAIWQLGNAWKRYAAAAIRTENVTYVQFLVLKAASDLLGTKSVITQTEIAGYLNANPMIISSVIRALKKQKLVIIRAHPRDSRAKRVLLSENGQLTTSRCCDILEHHEHVFFESITSDFDAFRSHLLRLAAAHPFVMDT